eukprot:2100608-Lingulodinium_polyedra.AAC.1
MQERERMATGPALAIQVCCRWPRRANVPRSPWRWPQEVGLAETGTCQIPVGPGPRARPIVGLHL